MKCEKCGCELQEVTTMQDLALGKRLYVHVEKQIDQTEKVEIVVLGECPK